MRAQSKGEVLKMQTSCPQSSERTVVLRNGGDGQNGQDEQSSNYTEFKKIANESQNGCSRTETAQLRQIRSQISSYASRLDESFSF